jgi:hypothetical protein
MRMKRFECINDERLTTKVFCTYRPGRKIFGIFSFEFTLRKPAHHIFVSIITKIRLEHSHEITIHQFQMDTYIKNSANRYMPTIIRMPKVDFCELFKSKAAVTAYFQILTMMYPPFLDRYGHLIHVCPYTEGVSHFNFENGGIIRTYLLQEILGVKNDTIKQIFVPSGSATSDVKGVFRFTDSANITYIQMTVLAELKGESLSFA